MPNPKPVVNRNGQLVVSTRNPVAPLLAMALICVAAAVVRSQPVRINIKVAPDAARLFIQGTCEARNVWSFRDSYAGVVGLGGRIQNFQLAAADGSNVLIRNIAPGQFESNTPATRFEYEVDISPRESAADAARISWLSSERGLLMLADLLPIQSAINGKQHSEKPVMVRLELPAGWSAFSVEKTSADQFEIGDPDRVVIAVGKNLRTASRRVGAMSLSFIVDGEWSFDNTEPIDMAMKIAKSHSNTFGSIPTGAAAVILFPFPRPAEGSKWSAETRGSTVTLLMGKLPSKVSALAQLSTPLTHELFHLWVPNGLALNGDYDWFYEGFTIYEAARTAVRLDLLTFAEFLNAIARAYDGYRLGDDADRLSLIEASKRRWTTGEMSVYSKSLVVAFLLDLRLRTISHGKSSLENVYRELFKHYGSTLPTEVEGKAESDGNDAAVNALTASLGSDDFVRMFVRNPVSINLSAELSAFGLTVESVGRRTQITVNAKLTRAQRDLLRQLGYNEITRATRSK